MYMALSHTNVSALLGEASFKFGKILATQASPFCLPKSFFASSTGVQCSSSEGAVMGLLREVSICIGLAFGPCCDPFFTPIYVLKTLRGDLGIALGSLK